MLDISLFVVFVIVIVMPILSECLHRWYQSTMMYSHWSHDRVNKYIYIDHWATISCDIVLSNIYLIQNTRISEKGRKMSLYFKIISYSWEVWAFTALAWDDEQWVTLNQLDIHPNYQRYGSAVYSSIPGKRRWGGKGEIFFPQGLTLV